MSEHMQSLVKGIGGAIIFIGVFGQAVQFTPIILIACVSIGWGLISSIKVFGKDINE